jgi:hypothetical protein
MPQKMDYIRRWLYLPQRTGILLPGFLSLSRELLPPMQEIMQFVSRHPVLSIAWIALLAAVLFTTFKSLMSKVKVITRGEATRLINKEDAVVVDLRQRDDFRKGHIAGPSTCCLLKSKRTTLAS